MSTLLRPLALATQNYFAGFDRLANEAIDKSQAANRQPIFIVGAPRTGSTLLYQLMIKHLKVAFISNLMALVPKKMLFIAKHTNSWMKKIDCIRESNYGYVPGLFSPNEAGKIMRSWFEEATTPEEKRLIRNTIIYLSDIFDAPFISKNLFNSLRLFAIYEILPEARFIHIHRDPLYTAQSIFLARRNALGSEHQWLGPKPDGYQASVDYPPLYQVLWQVKQIECAIAKFFQASAAEYLDITYESLCTDTETVLQRVVDTFSLDYKQIQPVKTFPIQDRPKLSTKEWSELLEHYSTLYPQ